MARFVFELQTVLDLRQREERDRERALAAALRERADAEREVQRLHRAAADERDELRHALAPGAAVQLPAARAQAAASVRLETLLRAAALRLSSAHQKAQAARRALILATTKRKAAQTLRDRRYEAWKLDQDRRETAQLDELAVMRAARAPEHDEPAEPRREPTP